MVTADLTGILKPNDPPDLRLKRLIAELAAVPRPESIITWMRNSTPKSLLAMIGHRELRLTHDAFDAIEPSQSVEHLREILVHHRMLPDRGNPYLFRFERWLEERIASMHPNIAPAIEQFGRWHHLRRLRSQPEVVRSMDNASRHAKQEITETTRFLSWLLAADGVTVAGLRQAHLDEYLAAGPSSRFHIRTFIRNSPLVGNNIHIPYRKAVSTPMVSSQQRLDLIRTTVGAEPHPAVDTHRGSDPASVWNTGHEDRCADTR